MMSKSLALSVNCLRISKLTCGLIRKMLNLVPSVQWALRNNDHDRNESCRSDIPLGYILCAFLAGVSDDNENLCIL